MASLVAGGMVSWAVSKEVDGADSKAIETAWKLVENMRKKAVKDGEGPRTVVNPKGNIKFADMPLRSASQATVMHACDAIVDLPMPMPDISEQVKENGYNALLEPLQPKSALATGVGVTEQTNICRFMYVLLHIYCGSSANAL